MSDKLRDLWVWMNGEFVGVWNRSRTGAHRFTYDESWLESPHSRPLSLSMPITADRSVSGDLVSNYFDNLLPDDERIRQRVASRFKTNSIQAFDMLQAIGRDCVGAVQLLPPDEKPTGFNEIRFAPLSDADIERHLQGVVAAPGNMDEEDLDDFRISIAGAQEKTALLRVDGQWCKPLGSTPTTHILKLPLGLVGGRKLDLTHSVQNEWLCAQILKALNLPVAETQMAQFGEQMVLSVERFDRNRVPQQDDSPCWIVRLPQEDFCQALGLPGFAKYENNGGPSMQQCVQILLGSDEPQVDVSRFLCAQLIFWFLAATDGHAKNFSLFLLPGGHYRMTPLYDVLSVWPVIGNGPNHVPWQKAKLAFAVRSKNAHYTLSKIQPRHWKVIALQSGYESVWQDMLSMVDRIDGALEAVKAQLPHNFHEPTANAIFDGVRLQLSRWKENAAVL